jgi:hypothetical protein
VISALVGGGAGSIIGPVVGGCISGVILTIAVSNLKRRKSDYSLTLTPFDARQRDIAEGAVRLTGRGPDHGGERLF